MDEKISGAIEVLLIKLKEQINNVNATKKAINTLRQVMGETPLFHETELKEAHNILRPDLYYGRPLATAAREYLESQGGASTTEEILKGLEEGGFDFDSLNWQEKTRLRNLSISLSKNTAVFHRLPNDTIGLLVWYPEVMKKKSEMATKERIQENHIEEEKKEEGEKEKINEK